MGQLTFGQKCTYCGGEWSAEDHGVKHTDDCPTNHVHVPASKPVRSLDAARFNKADEPNKLNPRTALVAALEWFDAETAAGRPITHVIVLTGRDSEEHVGASGTRYFQAGTYRHHGQMGLCLEGMHMMRDSGQ